MRGGASLTLGVLTAGTPEDFVRRPDFIHVWDCCGNFYRGP